MMHEPGCSCECGSAVAPKAPIAPPSTSLRVIRGLVTGLFALLAIVPVWMIVQDLADPEGSWFGFGLRLGGMALGAMAVLAVPLVLSWCLRRAPDGVRSMLALVSSTLLLVATLFVVFQIHAAMQASICGACLLP